MIYTHESKYYKMSLCSGYTDRLSVIVGLAGGLTRFAVLKDVFWFENIDNQAEWRQQISCYSNETQCQLVWVLLHIHKHANIQRFHIPLSGAERNIFVLYYLRISSLKVYECTIFKIHLRFNCAQSDARIIL